MFDNLLFVLTSISLLTVMIIEVFERKRKAMPKTTRPGFVIVLDGIDGCGKSGQSKRLVEKINEHFGEDKAVYTREPTMESDFGRWIRQILEHKQPAPGPETMQYLYYLDRVPHWSNEITPLVEAGKIVVSDRERAVTYAFGSAREVPIETMVGWHENLPMPDLFLLVKVSPEEAAKRIAHRIKEEGGQIEYFEKEETLRKNAAAFDEVVKSKVLPTLKVVDGEGSPEEVEERIWQEVLRVIDPGSAKPESPISVELLAETNQPPEDLAAFAAKTCYLSKKPVWASPFNVEKSLFEVGHHSTLEHTYFTFFIDGVPVGDLTFGLHLTTPFYDTDQRSGRYAKMFENPDFSEIMQYIKFLYSELETDVLAEIEDYLRFALGVYNDNKERADAKCLELLEAERPFLTDKMRSESPKMAQEQLRYFIPVVVPTALVYTIDLATLFGLYQSPLLPGTKHVVERMVEIVLEKHPELRYMFNAETRDKRSFAPQFDLRHDPKIALEPKVKLREINLIKPVIVSKREDGHPIDRTTTSPFFMDNEVNSILEEVWYTVVTYGQDQRHRAFRRSQPEFSGEFYLPPIPSALDLDNDAYELMVRLFSIARKVPDTLAAVLAPYGAVVHYFKRGSLNALAHEGGKRLCFCAQQEIYEGFVQLRRQVEKLAKKDSKYKVLLDILVPPCFFGPCAEPGRYCGRDMSLKRKGDYFPKRNV